MKTGKIQVNSGRESHRTGRRETAHCPHSHPSPTTLTPTTLTASLPLLQPMTTFPTRTQLQLSLMSGRFLCQHSGALCPTSERPP